MFHFKKIGQKVMSLYVYFSLKAVTIPWCIEIDG